MSDQISPFTLKHCQEYLDEVQVHSISEGYAMGVNIWTVDAFTGPEGVEFPARRHRSAVVLASPSGQNVLNRLMAVGKVADGRKLVLFQNTTIDEAALNGVIAARLLGERGGEL